jgi:L-xylulokinase
MLRALYEGVVYCHLSHINKLRTAGAQIKSARMTGGGSRSQVWTQMFADAIQIPMEVSDGIELGARGAALSAAIGAGIFRDYAEATSQAVSIERVNEPNPANAQAYLDRFSEYEKLVNVMQSSWDSLNKLD